MDSSTGFYSAAVARHDVGEFERSRDISIHSLFSVLTRRASGSILLTLRNLDIGATYRRDIALPVHPPDNDGENGSKEQPNGNDEHEHARYNVNDPEQPRNDAR